VSNDRPVAVEYNGRATTLPHCHSSALAGGRRTTRSLNTQYARERRTSTGMTGYIGTLVNSLPETVHFVKMALTANSPSCCSTTCVVRSDSVVLLEYYGCSRGQWVLTCETSCEFPAPARRRINVCKSVASLVLFARVFSRLPSKMNL
jgi:hypothetical protein